jgi:hypothetical protein
MGKIGGFSEVTSLIIGHVFHHGFENASLGMVSVSISVMRGID